MESTYMKLRTIRSHNLKSMIMTVYVELNIIKTGEGTVYKLTLVNADRKLFKGHIVVAILSQQ